jgi:peptide/nickel transport system substrate-binding protein
VQAIKWAIDYDAIARNITPQTYVVAQSFLPPGMPGALTERPFRKDTARARQLLAEAGLADGFSVQMLHFADPPFPGIAQVVQANLAEIGIKLQLVSAEKKQVITKFRNRQHEMALMRWGADYIDPHGNAWVFCANPDDSEKPKMGILAWRNHFVDQKMTKQVEDAFAERDQEKRMTIYADLQHEMWDHGAVRGAAAAEPGSRYAPRCIRLAAGADSRLLPLCWYSEGVTRGAAGYPA